MQISIKKTFFKTLFVMTSLVVGSQVVQAKDAEFLNVSYDATCAFYDETLNLDRAVNARRDWEACSIGLTTRKTFFVEVFLF